MLALCFNFSFTSIKAVYQEFMLATTMSEARSPEDKLRWAFRLYDKDGSGKVDKHII